MLFRWFRERPLRVALRSAYADTRLTTEELAGLAALAEAGGVPPERFAVLQRKRAQVRMKQIGKRAAAERRLDPVAIEAINHISASIGEGAELDPYDMTLFTTNWNLANGMRPLALPDELAKVNLQRGESAYYACGSTWIEKRWVREQIGSSGYVAVVPVIWRINYWVDTLRGRYQEVEQPATISIGRFVVTDRRILFVGDASSLAQSYERISTIELLNDTVRIVREGDTSCYFMLPADDAADVCQLVRHFLAQN
ncbi:hypothetical protein [Phreatobacter stygius]|uniref:Uncharacterized protein n=1 Tax=Phreatobacter stygius TaxID=1940610 RepID=A0A4D7B0N8_9HYPH|nr:hypothetical protein [Phreatobacter stygius]QCI67229.1 hypothetical protein E8M01_25140 [Phreatobacter stygius]